MSTNYDKIAGSYDFISRAVFGKALVNAQVSVLIYIPANSRILIAGGGTGWILEEIAKIHPQGLIIDYIESSAKMIALSQKRNYGTNQLNFINLPVENYITAEKYDVVLTSFFFDNFSADKIRSIFIQLNELLKQNSIWLYVDFVNGNRLWQKLLLRLMYFFFRITTHIETQELVNMDGLFDPLYHKTIELSHYHSFVKSVVYRKR